MESKPKLAIVISDFNDEITGKMEAAALKAAKESGADVVRAIHVPGALDMPLIAATLLEREDVDALAALGAVIRGETKHDEVVVNTCAKQLSDLSIEFGKPVGFGVIGPQATHAQGMARAEEYAARAVKAALMLLKAQEEAQKE